MGKAVEPVWEQATHRFVDNDAYDNAATLLWSNGSNAEIIVGEVFRIRFQFRQTLSTANANLITGVYLAFSHNSGSWTGVGTQGSSLAVRVTSSSLMVDGNTTTSRLGTYGTFVAGRFENTSSQPTFGWTAATEALSNSEYEWGLQLNPDVVASGDTIQLRCFEVITYGSRTYIYTTTPTITARKPDARQGNYRWRNDDGSETAATWKAAANTLATQSVPASAASDDFRLRFGVEEVQGYPKNLFASLMALQVGNMKMGKSIVFTGDSLGLGNSFGSSGCLGLYWPHMQHLFSGGENNNGEAWLIASHSTSQSTPPETYRTGNWSLDSGTLTLGWGNLISGGADSHIGIYIDPNGTRLFALLSGEIRRHTMSTAWDQTTASGTADTNQTLSTVFNDSPYSFLAESFCFSSDGTKLFCAALDSGRTVPEIWRYSLSTAWDLTTATQDQILYPNSGWFGTRVQSMGVSLDGKYLNILGVDGSGTYFITVRMPTANSFTNAEIRYDGSGNHSESLIGTSLVWDSTRTEGVYFNQNALIKSLGYFKTNWFAVTSYSSSIPLGFGSSPNYANGDDTTQQITAYSLYVTDNNAMMEGGSIATVSLPGSYGVELEWCLTLNGAYTKHDDEFFFKVQNADSYVA